MGSTTLYTSLIATWNYAIAICGTRFLSERVSYGAELSARTTSSPAVGRQEGSTDEIQVISHDFSFESCYFNGEM